MLPRVAGQMATVLVAFAATELRPSQISVGKVTSVPPPATELMTPARKAAPNAAAAWRGSSVDKYSAYVLGAAASTRLARTLPPRPRPLARARPSGLDR